MSSTSTCGCCTGIEQRTPVTIANRPGLSALAYRVGTHARFTQSMQTALGQHDSLRNLTTRADDDPSIALLDAWATVLDVLTFYQERIANEGYLRTSTERRSVLELARRIGYELRPGVAASTYLAFTMQAVPGAPESALVAEGSQAQSLPRQDEMPQLFETIETIETRAAWQAMTAQLREPHPLELNEDKLYLEGVDNNLQAGDALLFIDDERASDPTSGNWDIRRIKTLDLDRDRNLTHIVLDRGLSSFEHPAAASQVYVLRQRAALFGYNAPDWRAMPEEIQASYCSRDSSGNPNCTEWPDLSISEIREDDEPDGTLYLDAVYPKIVPDSWVVLSRPGHAEVYRVEAATEDARANFTFSAKTTRLELDGDDLEQHFDDFVRETVVFGQSEALPLAERPIERAVEGNTVTLAAAVDGLTEGRLIAVAGLDADTGEEVREIATLKQAEPVAGATRLTFMDTLAHRYERESVVLNANVARATHGKTTTEVLGSGDGSKTFQTFKLKQTPLTYVSAATASGAASTLEVRVNAVLWTEVPSLYGQPPEARVYITRLADDGTVTVQFGDGVTGARLPSGTENVTATYRHGSGLDGMVEAEQISLLMTRPLGVKGVVNPTMPTGADNPEALANARQNAPLTVLTLERIVSVQDFEDFARAFSGIGKAQAALLWNGERRLIHLTVAGADGSAVPDDSDLYANLLTAIDAARHVDEQVVVDSYIPLAFDIEAKVLVDDAYLAEDVLVAVETALIDAFSFEQRAFGQSVTASELLAVMQAIEGVIAVDLDRLGALDPFATRSLALNLPPSISSPIPPVARLGAVPRLGLGGSLTPLRRRTIPPVLSAPLPSARVTTGPSSQARLLARTAYWDGAAIQPAELLTINPNGITLTEMTP